MLEDFEVRPLGRINLIVGKNNSGKSTVLEALRILAGNANPTLLEQIAIGHDEKAGIVRNEPLDDLSELPFQDFFTGRKFPSEEKNEIYIGECDSGTKRFVKISHVFFVSETEEIRDEDGDMVTRTKRKVISGKNVRLSPDINVRRGLEIKTGRRNRSVLLEFDKPNPFRLGRTIFDGLSFDGRGTGPVSHIPTQFISINDLADIWDQILFTEHAEWIKQGLAIISNDFEDLAFVRSDENPPENYKCIGPRPDRKCKVKLKGLKRAVPLNSLGDGMLRVLQIMLKIYPAKGGTLLIDEFENGFHYSVQEKIWALLFDLSVRLDIQVFATTHSWDCIESFAKVATHRKDIDGVLFRVGRSVLKSDKDKVIATVFNEDKLARLTQADVEVR